jgi:hypothetical protein
VTAGSVTDSEHRLDAARGRALDLLKRALIAAVESTRTAAMGQPARLDDWGADALAQWQRAMELIDSIGMELYFASGAYGGGKSAVERPGPTGAERRFYTEARVIFDALVEVGFPHVVHQLLETLEHFVEVDPRGVFMRIVTIIRAGRAWGYEYDNLAEPLFVRLVERYIAEYRTLLQQDIECSRALVEMLDVFVQAGWPSARRITYGLSEIFR